MQNIVHKYRIYPNIEQQQYFEQTFGACRWLWNHMLSDRNDIYKRDGETYYPKPSDYKIENPWLKDIDSLALCNVQLNLQSAYSNFFKSLKGDRKGKKISHPKFKSKKRCKQRYKTNVVCGKNGSSNIKIDVDNGTVRLPKIDSKIKTIFHRPLPKNSIVKNVSIEKTVSSKYYIAIGMEIPERDKIIPDITKAVGIDFSMNNIYVTSDGEKANHQHWFRRSEKLLKLRKRRYNRRISKIREKHLLPNQKKLTKDNTKKFREELRNSKNLEKLRIRAGTISERVSNQRKDTLLKEAFRLINKYDVLIFEDINLQTMSRCLNFGKSVADAGFGIFRNRIEQLCNQSGKIFFVVDKWFPSSKMCNKCRHINKDLKLSDREWICPECGTILDRDVNAGINLKNNFLENNTVGTAGINALGDVTSTFSSSLLLASNVNELGKMTLINYNGSPSL